LNKILAVLIKRRGQVCVEQQIRPFLLIKNTRKEILLHVKTFLGKFRQKKRKPIVKMGFSRAYSPIFQALAPYRDRQVAV
jgi:hypothetical protein